MQINTAVVRALLQLKGVDTATAAKLTHIPHAHLLDWLQDDSPEMNESVPFEVQLELLNLLGVRDGAPRNDVVHYWRIYEPLFTSSAKSYASLQTVLKAFGPAQAAYIAREADPMLMTEAKAHFALKFVNFLAILEVSAHPLRSISFNPGEMPDLSWTPGSQGVLLSGEDYLRLEPGSMRVKGLSQCLTYSTEVSQWDRLRESAIEYGISAEHVASLLLEANPQLAKLPSKAPAPKPVTAPVHRAPEPPAAPDMFSEPVVGL